MNLQAPLPYVFSPPKARSSRINPNAAPEARINNNTFHCNVHPTVHRSCSTIWPSLTHFYVSIINSIVNNVPEKGGWFFLFFVVDVVFFSPSLFCCGLCGCVALKAPKLLLPFVVQLADQIGCKIPPCAIFLALSVQRWLSLRLLTKMAHMLIRRTPLAVKMLHKKL